MESVKKTTIYIFTVHACIVCLAFGTCVGWSSPIVPTLRYETEDSPLTRPVTVEEEGWITSLISLGAFGGSLIGGPMANWIGRKWTLLLSAVVIIVSFIFLIVARSVGIILAARSLQGVAGGLALTALPMFIGEIATDDTRGGAGSLITLFKIIGILYSYVIGPYVNYAVLQWCCIAIPIIFLCTFYFIPDSPHYLAIKGRPAEAKKSLQFFRGQSLEAVEKEMAQIQSAVEKSIGNRGTLVDIIRNRGYRKAVFITCSLLCFQQLTGTPAVMFNSQSIFISANSPLDPAIASIILMLVQLGANFLTPFVVERSGRRIILMISSIGMCVSLFALGAFFYVQAFVDASSILWIPIPALILFNLMFSFGFAPIPYAVLGEMFPSNIKPIATSIAVSLGWLAGFLVARWFPELNALGPYYAFWMFGTFCIVALLFVIFVMIETKGLNVEAIQEKLNE